MNLINLTELSIIIVTYNNEQEIGRCLFSLASAVANIPTQVIVIDNNSLDNTPQVIEKELSHFKTNNLIKNKQNLGFTKAINQGLKLTQGKYILLLNPDTALSADTFQKLLPLFNTKPDVGIIAPQLLNTDGSVQPSCRRFPRHRDIFFHILGLNLMFPSSKLFNCWKMGDFDHNSEKFVEQPQGAFLLTHRQAFNNVGLLDENFPMFFSDVDWCHRFIDNGWKILFTPAVRILHHKGKSIYKNRAPLIWSSHVSFYRYFKKYYRKGLWPVVNFLTGLLLIKLAFIRMLFEKIGGIFKFCKRTG